METSQVCRQCAQPIAADALLCVHCGARQSLAAAAAPVTAPSAPRHSPLPLALGLLLAALAILLVLALRGLQPAARAVQPATPASTAQLHRYLKQVTHAVLPRRDQGDTLSGLGIAAMQSRHPRRAVADFRRAEARYSQAIRQAATLHPTDEYLRYHDDVLQGLTDSLRSVVAYNQWAASGHIADLQRGNTLAHRATALFARASVDAPAG